MKFIDAEDSSLFQLLWTDFMRIICRKPKSNRAKHVRRINIKRV